MTRFVAYFRVSTRKQGTSGLGLSAQREAVTSYVRSVGGTICAEFREVESGKRKDRPELARALSACRVHGAVLCIAKLDRLSRNLLFLAQLMESRTPFICCDMPNANEMTIGIMASVAQGEAKMISDRTKAALAAAKARGVTLGGDHGNLQLDYRKGIAASLAKRSARAQQRATDLAPVIADLRANGAASLAQIADGLNARNIPAPRGGQWRSGQVFVICKQADAHTVHAH